MSQNVAVIEKWNCQNIRWEIGGRNFADNLKVPDLIHNIIPHCFQTHCDFDAKSLVIDCCGDIWCEYSKYFRRNQWKCYLENKRCGPNTK